MSIRFDDRVVIITGAGGGLGRAHALGFAARGARVVVNDLGRGAEASDAAQAVVDEIRSLGGKAIADGANVADFAQVEAMVAKAKTEWGRVDVLINNAGILRDKTFAKMELADFRAVVDVHLMGAVHGCKAVWEMMREQAYGRIVMTTSSAGLYGNFGQANYGAAKAALVGLMNVLGLEGERYGIRVNALAPAAATRMTEGLLPQAAMDALLPEFVTPGVMFLAGEDAPNRTILSGGAGAFAVARIVETAGLFLLPEERSPEGIADRFAAIAAPKGAETLPTALDQTHKFVRLAGMESV